MANQITTKRRTLTSLAGLCLATLLSTAMPVFAQDFTPQPPRARQLLKTARDLFGKGEYDAAAQYYAQVESQKEMLTATERSDLAIQMAQNSTALAERQKGILLIDSAENCLAAGRTQEADNYLRLAQANQFLGVTDRQRVQTLTQNLMRSRGGVSGEARGNSASLLAAAREALKRGDFDGAEALARQAEKAPKTLMSSLAVWSDSPARVLDEIRVARSKMANDVPAPKFPMDTTSNPGRVTNSSPANGTTPETKLTAAARHLVMEGYKALEANDFEKAKSFAMQAKDMNAGLDKWQPNPEQLLADIARRTNTNDVVAGADPVAILKQGRQFYNQQRYDDAEKLANQAEAFGRRYGLFEDSPKKLKDDVARARAQLDVERSGKLVAEARRQLKQNNFAEARTLATEAKKLNPANNSFFGWNDTPDAVLRDVARLERINPQPLAPAPLDIAQVNKLESAETRNANRARATALVADARQLEHQGHLVEARTKAAEAQKISVQWGPMDDTPEAVLRDLGAKAATRVHNLLEQATEMVSNNPTDSTRFQKADHYLVTARRLAEAFRQDTAPIDRKTQWLQQAAAQSRSSGAVAQVPALQSVQALSPAPFSEPSEPGQKQSHQDAMQKLEKARFDLAAGDTTISRKLAEDAFTCPTARAEAQKVLRSIDDEEHKQKQVAAIKNFQAGLYHFERKDYPKAATIFAAIDVTFLPAEHARKLGEVISCKEMHGSMRPADDNSLANRGTGTIVQTTSLPPAPLATPPGAGVKSIDDRVDPYLEAKKAMDKINADKFRDLSLGVQKQAQQLATAGQEQKAIDLLHDFQVRLKESGLNETQQAGLDRPVSARIKNLQEALASKEIERQRKIENGGNVLNMNERTLAKLKTQEKIKELCDRGRQHYKEGKYDDAIACANKALELDSDCQAAIALRSMAKVRDRKGSYESDQAANEDFIWRSLNRHKSPDVDFNDPIRGDKKHSQTLAGRKDHSPFGMQKSQKELVIERKLAQSTKGINFVDVPLYRVLQDLQAMSSLNINVDRSALERAEISLQQPISIQVDDISLKSVLNIILRQARLTYVIRNEVIDVTTEAEAVGKRKVLTYSVADLVVPVDNHGTSPINSFEEALKRHINSSKGGVSYAPPTPYVPQGGIASGTPVSQNGPGGPSFHVSKSNANTIENLVINLITNTIAPNSWEQAGGEGRIQYFPLGHALVISQVQEVQEEVQALLNALRKLQDIQISIEMRVVSVSEKFFERIGLDFDVNFKSPTYIAAANQLQNGTYGPNTGINRNLYVNNVFSGLTPAGTLTPDLGVPIRASSMDFTIPPFGGYPGTLGADGGLTLGLAFLSDIQVFMLLEAAQGDQRTHIMQAPKITVFNAQTANISVQDQLFFLTSVSIAQAGAQTFFVPQQQPFPIGVGMQVTPVVSADRRFVRLNLVPQITNLISANIPLIPVQIPVPQLFDAPGGQGYISGQPVIFQMFFQQPSFTSIDINTTVNVPDGGTVLLGGLKTMAEGRNEFGPPILSKIPYLNRLFRNQAWGREAQSVMVMVTPRIIINEEIEQEILGQIAPIPR